MQLTALIAAPGAYPLLGECIDSVRPFADEILIAGLADSPASTAPQSGTATRTLAFDRASWNDPGAVLSEALDQAAGDWVLFLEAHERLAPGGIDLRSEIRHTECDALSLKTRRLSHRPVPCHRPVDPLDRLTHGAISASERSSLRLFRRGYGCRFGVGLEPLVAASLRPRTARIGRTDAVILQYPLLVPEDPQRLRSQLARARALVARFPQNPQVWLDFGRLLLGTGRFPSAARECCLAAWRIGGNRDAAFLAAQVLALEERFDDSLAMLDQIVDTLRDPEGEVGAPDVCELRGEVLRMCERSEEAVAAYRAAVDLAHDRPTARVGLVELLCDAGRVDSAQAHGEWLRSRYPGLAESWIADALVHLAAGRPVSAIDSLSVALDIQPDSAAARFNLAIAYARVGASQRAHAALRQARETRGGIALARVVPSQRDKPAPVPTLHPVGENGVVTFIPQLAGGAGRVAVDIARSLHPHYPQAVITIDKGDFTRSGLAEELAALGIQVASIGSSEQLRALQRLLKPALLIYHSGPPDTQAEPAGAEPFLISVSHGEAPFVYTHHDLYVCLSEAHRRHHHNVPDERVTIIPNGVAVARFAEAAPDLRHWPHGLHDGSVRIAMLTRLDHTKCARRLLTCLDSLSDLPIRIVVAGRGQRRWEIDADRGRFAIGPKVHFVGPIAPREVPGFLAAADIGLHLTETDYETQSLTILEMMSAGLPIVSQPRGCLPELIETGINGFLSEREEEIARALRELVASKRKRREMGAAGQERAAAYDVHRFAQRWRDLVARSLAARRARPKPPLPPSRQRTAEPRAGPSAAHALALGALPAPQPPASRPSSYLIATGPRCGGTLLSTALNATGVAGYPQEIFATWFGRLEGKSWRYRALDDYLLAQYHDWASPRGVFGCRIMFDHFESLRACLGTGDWPSRWLAQLGRTQWIFLRRRDRIAQAISLFKAQHSGVWWDVGDPPVGVSRLTYDRTAIEASRQRLERSEQGWQAFFAETGIEPIELWYEDLARDVEGTVRDLLQRLGIDPPVPFFCRTRLRRQADNQTREWQARFARGD